MYTRIKTADEIDKMRISGKILAEIHEVLKTKVTAGVTTKYLADIARNEVEKRKVGAPFYNYGSPIPFPEVICISVNDEVVHGIPSNRELQDGDVVSLDLGIEYEGMITDSAITVICGKTSTDIDQLVSRTKKALHAGLKVIKDGCRVGDVGNAIEKSLLPYNYGIVRDLVGHGVGHEIHEEPNIPNFGKKGTGPKLLKGMTVAIEPMVTLGNYGVHTGQDKWTVLTNDGSISAHFEHTVLVTENGYEILTTC